MMMIQQIEMMQTKYTTKSYAKDSKESMNEKAQNTYHVLIDNGDLT